MKPSCRHHPLVRDRRFRGGHVSSQQWLTIQHRSIRSSATTCTLASRHSTCTLMTRRGDGQTVHIAKCYDPERVKVRVRDSTLAREWEAMPSWPRLRLYAEREVQARQMLNCEHAIARCRVTGEDWLLHVDSDELLYLPSCLAELRESSSPSVALPHSAALCLLTRLQSPRRPPDARCSLTSRSSIDSGLVLLLPQPRVGSRRARVRRYVPGSLLI